jgi:hypothetical protein
MTIISVNEKNNHDQEGNPCSVPSIIGRPTQFFLTSSGDGQGPYNLNGDYSASPTDFYYQTTSTYYIQTLLVTISDSTTFNQTDYGGISTGTIINGVKVFIKPSGLSEIPLLSGVAFKYNYEWLQVTPDTILTQFSGTPQTLTINFDITHEYGMPIMLNTGDRFIIRLNDNFTGLVSHTFGLRGRKV